MSERELAIIIKAHYQAQQGFQQLSTALGAVARESTGAAAGAKTFEAETRRAQTTSVAAGVVIADLASRALVGLKQAFVTCVGEANRLEAGLTGLGSIARAFNVDAQAAQGAAQALASEGIMSVGEAATGLKNLLASGFSLDQATELMNRFKDSAAFGRQGALDFGQAIVGATEGIKNGNSALVDNVGLSKNLSNILVEAGFSAQDLSKATSDVNVRMALYHGLLKETNPQVGDLARYLQTAAGQMDVFDARVRDAQQEIGKQLQPALLLVLKALMPVAEAIGDNAELLVKLGGLAAVAAAPFVAIRTAALLGLPSLRDMKAGLDTVTSAIRAMTAAQTTQGLAGVATELGGIGNALARIKLLLPAGAGMAALFGATAGAGLAAAWSGYEAHATRTEDAMRRLEAQQLLLAEASRLTGQRVTDATGAWTLVDAALQRAASSGQTLTAEQQRLKDALVATNPFVGEHTNQLVAMGDMVRKAREEQAAAIPATERLAAAMQQFTAQVQQDIAATGMSVPQLTTALQRDEAAFLAWAKSVNLSDDALKFLQQTVKGQEEAHKKSEQATKAQTDAQRKLTEELSKLGVVSAGQVQVEFKRLTDLLDAAAKIGTPALTAALVRLRPEFDALLQKAQASGLAVDGLTTAMQRYEERASVSVASTRDFNTLVGATPVLLGAVDTASQDLIRTTRTQIAEEDRLREAYETLGLKAPEALRKTADEAVAAYERIRQSGTATPEQVKEAFEKAREAINATNGKIPSFWATEVVPGITRSVETLQTAISGSFAQMLIGAKSFGEGFTDIWKSIKASVLNIFNQIVEAFMSRVLNGILGALRGQQGAFSQAFAGMFGGGGNGLAGLLGGGAAAAGAMVPAGSAFAGMAMVLPSGAVLPWTMGGTAAGTGGGSFLGVSGAGLAGGALAGGAGIGMGLLGKYLTGGAGAGAAAIGAAGGAGTGALIGSIVPGIGTAIGAVIGGLAGAITGLFGQTAGQKAGKEADAAIADAQSRLLAQYGSLQNIAAMGTQGAELAAAWGSRNVAGAAHFATLLQQFERAVPLLAQQKQLQTDILGLEKDIADEEARHAGLVASLNVSFSDVQGIASRYGIEVTQLGTALGQLGTTASFTQVINDFDQLSRAAQAAGGELDWGGVLSATADELSEMVQVAMEAGLAIPANMRPYLEEMVRAGLLVDEHGEKLEDLGGIQWGAAVETEAEKTEAAMRESERMVEEMRTAVGELKDALMEVVDRLANHLPAAAQTGASGIETALGGIEVPPIDVRYRVSQEGDGLPDGVTLPGAANGILATTPVVRAFAEAEPELAGPVSFMSRALAGALQAVGLPVAGSAGPQVIQVVLPNGRVLAEAVVPEIPRVLQARGTLR